MKKNIACNWDFKGSSQPGRCEAGFIWCSKQSLKAANKKSIEFCYNKTIIKRTGLVVVGGGVSLGYGLRTSPCRNTDIVIFEV